MSTRQPSGIIWMHFTTTTNNIFGTQVREKGYAIYYIKSILKFYLYIRRIIFYSHACIFVLGLYDKKCI